MNGQGKGNCSNMRAGLHFCPSSAQLICTFTLCHLLPTASPHNLYLPRLTDISNRSARLLRPETRVTSVAGNISCQQLNNHLDVKSGNCRHSFGLAQLRLPVPNKHVRADHPLPSRLCKATLDYASHRFPLHPPTFSSVSLCSHSASTTPSDAASRRPLPPTQLKKDLKTKEQSCS